MEHDVLFKTAHGSRLYGLSHAGSDEDWYTVVDKVKTKKAHYSTHKIIGEDDSVVVDFGTFVDYATKGVPQALEAMFAREPHIVTDEIADFRAGFHVGTHDVIDRYLRTIKAFIMEEDEPREFKRRRHGFRLALNLKSLRQYGRFNPTLTRVQAALVTNMATKMYREDAYRHAVALAWS